MSALTLRAPAKLNLFLHILNRRDDGYHTIESLVVFTEFADVLSITPSDRLALIVEGEFANQAGVSEENLVLKAARALQAATNTKLAAQLRLTKNIPVGAGLGGGSADAAAALRGLARLWKLNLDQRELREIALKLGADVTMCLDSTPAIARGIGEQLTPVLKLPALYAVLVHPRTPLLTKDVYAAFEAAGAVAPWSETISDDAEFSAALTKTRNHLQRAAISIDGSVAEVLLTLETLQPQPSLVRMTGSGACCFALYTDRQSATNAAKQLAQHYTHWWVQATSINQH